MKISRFFGANSRDVMRQVRQVLGPDALIVSNRSVDGGIEVLATVEGAFDDVPQESPRQPAPQEAAPQPAYAAPAATPQPGYAASQPAHVAPQPGYVPPQPAYVAPQPAYAAPAGAPQPGYAAPARSIAAYQSAYASSALPEQDELQETVAPSAPPVVAAVSYTHLTLPTILLV